MNIKHLFITILALLPFANTFHINGMLTTKKTLSKLSQQQILRYSSQLPQNDKYPLLKAGTIADYNRERDEKTITNIASKHLPKLMSDITPKNHQKELNTMIAGLNNSTRSTSKVYLLDNKPIGFINYYIAHPYIRCHLEPTTYINWIAIDDAYQGKGIGSALLQHALDESNRQSVAKITLSTTDWRLENYYHKFGFICTHNSKSTGGQELTKRLQPHPIILLYRAMRTWFDKFKE